MAAGLRILKLGGRRFWVMRRLLLVAALIGSVLPAVARADGQFDLSIGYAHQWLEGSDRFEQRDGIRFEPRISNRSDPSSHWWA